MTMLRLARARRRRRTREPVIAAAAAVAAAGAAIAVFLRRRGRVADGRELWACACGERYLVSGRGRHRVYWLPDSPHSDPVLGRECVSCGAPLAAGDSESATPVEAHG